VLLDANIVIEAYKLGVWDSLVKRVDVIVPSIVAHDEALFYSRKEGAIPEAINLPKLISKGKVQVATATQLEMASMHAYFDRAFIQGIDAGELEALTLVKEDKVQDAFFCTGDAAGIKALAMIGHSESGISMERLLLQLGLKKPLDKQFTDKFFKECLEQGKENLITRIGLRKK